MSVMIGENNEEVRRNFRMRHECKEVKHAWEV